MDLEKEIPILSFEEIYKILQNDFGWYYIYREQFLSICDSIHRLDNNITPEDIKHDFLLYTQEKKEDGSQKRVFHYKKGLIFGLQNFSKARFNKLKKKEVKNFDSHLFNEYCHEILNDLGLAKYDKKYLSYFIARQSNPKISPLLFGLDNIAVIHDKGLKYGGKQIRTSRKKIIKLNFYYIILLSGYAMDKLDDDDKMLISFIRDKFTGFGLSQYYGSVDVFSKNDDHMTIKEYLCIDKSTKLLLKILNIMGVE